MKQKSLTFSVLFILFLMCCPCTLFAQNTYKIGVTVPLSGPWAQWGTDLKNGLILSSNSTKNKFEFDLQDDLCSGRSGLSNVHKFTQIDQITIIFAGCVEIMDAISPILDPKKHSLVALGGMEKRILQRNPSITSFSSLTDSEAYFLVPYLLDQTKIQSIALVNGTNLFGETLGASIATMLKDSRIKLHSHHSVALETADFKPIITKILQSPPDAIWVHQGDTAIGIFLKQLYNAGYKGKIYSVFSLENLPLESAENPWLEGVIYTFPTEVTTKSAELQSFNKTYKAAYGNIPGATSKIAYDALQVLDQAIQKCGGMNNLCINKYFRALNEYEGLSGSVSLFSDGSAIRPFGLKTYKNGQFVTLVERLSNEF